MENQSNITTLRRTIAIFMIAGSMIMPAGCADQKDKYAQIGAIGGVLLGTYLGSRVGDGIGRELAMAGGMAVGGLAGYYLGHKLDTMDQEKMEEATGKALTSEIDKEIEWNNPETGNHGSITPVREQTLSSGNTCREFNQKIQVKDELETRRSLACRADNGNWYVVQDEPVMVEDSPVIRVGDEPVVGVEDEPVIRPRDEHVIRVEDSPVIRPRDEHVIGDSPVENKTSLPSRESSSTT